MTVPSFLFLAFAAVIALGVNLSRRTWWREGAMMAANLCFLASFAATPTALAPLVAFVLFGYVLFWLQFRRKPALLWLAVLSFVFVFLALKKYTFIPDVLIIHQSYVVLGVSYTFFRMMHLIIDAGEGAMERPIGPVSYLNYVLHFPCMVAGPIQMYPDYEAGRIGRPSLAALGRSIERIVIGMLKLLILGGALGALQSRLRDAVVGGGVHDIISIVELVASYPLYLYLNFSGYTDVVIGVSVWLGQIIPENFDRPFVSRSFIEFWSRWHMSLSNWLRTYVYNPFMMQGMARTHSASAANLVSIAAFFVTFFLVGLWHGQTAAFIVFGVLQGGGVAANKAWQLFLTGRLGPAGYRSLSETFVYGMFARGLTFTWFAFTAIWFWNDSRQIDAILRAPGTPGLIAALAGLFLCASMVLQAWVSLDHALTNAPWLIALRRSPEVRTAVAAAMVVTLIVLEYAISAPPPAVVYKAF